MIQIVFVFSAAIVLELLGAYMAVVGLSSKSSTLLVTLAIALDFSKIVIAAVLYKNWKQLNIGFKLYLLPTLLFLMLVTSYGAYAYLIQEFNKTTANQVQLELKISSIQEEKEKLEARKKDIDAQIAEVPATFVTQKRRLTEMFQEELNFTNNRIQELDRELPALKQQIIEDRNQAGTLGSLAKAWGTEPDQTIKILALMMVVVIDPLAITMLMVGNFLIIQRKEKLEAKELQLAKEKKEREEKIFELQKMKILTKNSNVEAQSKESAIEKPEMVTNVAAVEPVQKMDEVSVDNNEPIVSKESFDTLKGNSEALQEKAEVNNKEVEQTIVVTRIKEQEKQVSKEEKSIKNSESTKEQVKPKEAEKTNKSKLVFANKPASLPENVLTVIKKDTPENKPQNKVLPQENVKKPVDDVDFDIDDILNIVEPKDKNA